MRVLHNRIICCIFAVLMLFSGMCLDNNKADAMFSSEPVSHSLSVIDSLDKEVLENQSCTIEMLGIRNVTNAIRAVKRSNFKMDTRISTILFCADLFQHNISIIHGAVSTARLPELYYKAAVINYIQDKDGKK